MAAGSGAGRSSGKAREGMAPGVRRCVLGLWVAAGQLAMASEEPVESEPADSGPVEAESLDSEPMESESMDSQMYGPTTADDTLWSIAREVSPPGATVADTVAALQRMNPEAFLDGNPNLLMRGVMLRVPATPAAVEAPAGATELEPDSPAEADTVLETEEVVFDETEPMPAMVEEDPAILVAELEQSLEGVRTELEVAKDRNQALEGQISTMRRRIAEMEKEVAEAQASNDAGTDLRNMVMGIVVAVLVLVGGSYVYVRSRRQRGDDGQEGPPHPRGARRIATRPAAPETPETPETVPDEYPSTTKLNLARAFVDMGRTQEAREVLGEVLAEGSEDERNEAKDILDRME